MEEVRGMGGLWACFLLLRFAFDLFGVLVEWVRYRYGNKWMGFAMDGFGFR